MARRLLRKTLFRVSREEVHVRAPHTTDAGRPVAQSQLASRRRPAADVRADDRRYEVLAILGMAATILLGLSLYSYDARGGENWIGPVGASTAALLASSLGLAAWLLPAELLYLSVGWFRRRSAFSGPGALASGVVVVLIGCALTHLGWLGHVVFGGHLPGGLLGEVLGEVMRSLLGFAGSWVLGVALLLAIMVWRTPLRVSRLLQRVWTLLRQAAQRARDGLQGLRSAWAEARQLGLGRMGLFPRTRERTRERTGGPFARSDAPPSRRHSADKRVAQSKSSALVADEENAAESGPPAASIIATRLGSVAESSDEPALPSSVAPPADGAEDTEEDLVGGGPSDLPAPPVDRAASAKLPSSGGRKEDGAPTIVAPPEGATALTPESGAAPPGPHQAEVAPSQPFELPPTSLFDAPPPQAIEFDESVLREHAVRLSEKLEAYGVRGRVDEIHPGPVVTMYEFEPKSGTKISKIAGLSDDLAMALAAQKVRIVAPIPGKARVGFELPNQKRQTVFLREILEDPRWPRLRAALPVAFGKDITGQPVYGDLAKMPHLLVAGATGSGKSVGLNVLLASLLARRSPEEVRLLMIDPKVVELAVFDGIPHMLLPVVTDMNKAALALRWAVDEMERRYQLFADAGARSIATYNARVEKVHSGALSAEKLFRARRTGMQTDEPIAPPDKLPYVVVVVDEFADLMMVAAKDVEGAIARLAQKARAAGIHVILATQRPSVDVITGMIKANFPARMAFKVSQREDSKVILGRSGAEHLLGMGDMLMIPPGASDLHRVHSAYISEDEVRSLCDFLRDQGRPIYDEKILEPREPEAGPVGGSEDDPVYDRAVACVAQAGYCSISHIQRQLSVGYNKAAKLVERMEQEGVVGPASGKAGGRREVLVQSL